MAWGAAAAAAGNAIAGAASSAVGAAFNAKQAKLQRRFERRMYRHRYQYTVEDLRKAGLNPILATGGSPGVPSGGAAASMAPPDLGHPGSTATDTYQRLSKLSPEKALLDAQRGAATAQEHYWNNRTDAERGSAEAGKALGDFYSTPFGRYFSILSKDGPAAAVMDTIQRGGSAAYDFLNKAYPGMISSPKQLLDVKGRAEIFKWLKSTYERGPAPEGSSFHYDESAARRLYERATRGD